MNTLFRWLWLYFLVVYICACTSFANMTNHSQAYQTYLALGDSYTIGEGVLHNHRYPNLLVQALNKKGYHIAKAQIIAKSGWSCEELMNAIREAEEENKLAKTYDIVSLLIGVNDQYRGYDIADYPARFEKLLQKAIYYAGGNTTHVVVLSIPDWGVTPFAKRKGKNSNQIAQEIDAYNRINKEISLKYKVKYIDITAISRAANEQRELLTIDGLHPSGKMYALWVKKIIEQI